MRIQVLNCLAALPWLLILACADILAGPRENRGSLEMDGELDPLTIKHILDENANLLYEQYTEGDIYEFNEQSGGRLLYPDDAVESDPLVVGRAISPDDGNLLAISLSGNVEQTAKNLLIESLRRNFEEIKPGEGVGKWDKIFTFDHGAQIKFLDDISGEPLILLELGRNSLLQIMDIDRRQKKLRLFLSEGRLRVKVLNGKAEVRTISANVKIYKGYTDLILSALNTLAAPREGESIVISTVKNIRRVPVGYYGLATDTSGIYLSKAVTDRIEKEQAIIHRRDISEKFHDTKSVMKKDVRDSNVKRRMLR